MADELQAPPVGAIQDGFQYVGGDPSKVESWQPVQESWGDYAKGMGRSAAQGATLGFGDEVIAAGRSALGGGEYQDKLSEERGALEAFRAKHPYASLGAEMAGGVALPIPGAAAATGLREGITAGKVLKGAATVGAPTGAAYALGTAEGLDPTKQDAGEFIQQAAETAGRGALTGAAGYAVGAPLGELASRAVRPMPAAEQSAIRTLERENVRLTPGMMGGDMARWLEDSLSSIPFVGQVIRRAQREATEDINTAQINRSLRGAVTAADPHGEVLPPHLLGGGHEAVDHAATRLSNAYEEILPKLRGDLDPPLLDKIDRLKAAVADLPGNVDGALEKRFQKIVDVNLMRRASRDPATLGAMEGEAIKKAESELTRLTRDYLKDPSADIRDLGMHVGELQDALREMVMRHNPAEAPILKRINEGWANYVIARKAAGSTAAPNGQFNATQLHKAVKASDRSLDHGNFARGRALGQDLSGAAKQIIPARTPNSGTSERSMLGNILAGSLVLNPIGLIGAGGIAAAYSRPGQALIRRAMRAAPRGSHTVADALSRGAARTAGGVAGGRASADIVNALMNRNRDE